MREFERISRVMKLIEQLWSLDPDQRFLQLISNLESSYSKDNNNKGLIEYEKIENGVPWKYRYIDLFNLEDDKLERYLLDLISRRRKKHD